MDDKTYKRFLKKVNKDGRLNIDNNIWPEVNGTKCWEWTGACGGFGHGVMHMKKPSTRMAHILNYIHAVGEVSDGMCVCHKCDNPKCVNQDHLFLGTKKDNTHDMMKKGRHVNTCFPKGDDCEWSKVTSIDVLNIRSRIDCGETYGTISPDYPMIKRSQFYRIRNRTSWKNI